MLVMSKNPGSEVNGPGLRAVIHTQGCSLGCKGCFNPQSHVFQGKDESVYDVASWILSLEGLEGVTWSGGEPMQQAPEVWLVMELVHASKPELSFGMFTGYTKAELDEGRWTWHSRTETEVVKKGDAELAEQVFNHLDFAVMGRYSQAKACSDKPLCGSSNQEVVFVGDRYTAADLTEQEVEMVIQNGTGLVSITGFPTAELAAGLAR